MICSGSLDNQQDTKITSIELTTAPGQPGAVFVVRLSGFCFPIILFRFDGIQIILIV